MTVWKFRAAEAGAHVHATVFVAEHVRATYANCGNLTMSREEFDNLVAAIRHSRVIQVDWVTPESDLADRRRQDFAAISRQSREGE